MTTLASEPMNAPLKKQHLIDPEICIRCNTCEETCPVDAITHDSNNYVVNAEGCNGCMACISPCPTGSIDNWRTVVKSDAYSIEDQLTWDVLPVQTTTVSAVLESAPQDGASDNSRDASAGINVDTTRGSTLPPWSAA